MDLLLKEEIMIDHFDVQEIWGPQGSMWHVQAVVGDVEDTEEAVDTMGRHMGRIHCKNMADKVGGGMFTPGVAFISFAGISLSGSLNGLITVFLAGIKIFANADGAISKFPSSTLVVILQVFMC